LTTKSKELSSDLARGHASSSRPYNKVGMHLVLFRLVFDDVNPRTD